MKTNNLIITPYQDEYRDKIIDLIVNIQQNEFDLPITADDQPDLKAIPDFYQKDKGNFWAALMEDRVVGTISLLDIGGGNGALRKMFVDKKYRGPEYGVARGLLDKLLDWCRDREIARIYLGTTPKFLAAHRFYEKNGFEVIQKEELPASFPIMKVDTKFYKYSL